ncbi:prepilin peptidase [Yersinia similis]|nr:prepilin peptidase [Yersinia similis]CFQ70880.1 putative tight adherance operon protein [Yersinia similis]CNC50182.1 putative tight adherance operon protein [Yersinia similis]CNF56374.1 putative tight adherance operon protein [Yersinia similis]CNF57636.1 putative tight adherance operon protein [Yersinia similis]CNI29011.1 putative tight adherance operon protein [Yersinia similis]
MWLNYGVLLIWCGILSRICYTDIRYRLIKNKDILILLILVISTLFILDKPFNYPCALITLAIGFILVTINIVGAGDIKLLAVLALTFPDGIILGYLLVMSILGSILAIIEFIRLRFEKRQSRGLPYGVAIIGSYLFVIYDLFIT